MSKLGLELADYVMRERDTTLYEDALALMKIAEIAPHFRECVMSTREFESRFGWS